MSLVLPNWDRAVTEIKKLKKANPDLIVKAKSLGGMYRNKRGLMVVDCVASRQRRYESFVVPKLLPIYVDKAEDLSLNALARKAPKWMPLKNGEAETMQLVAKLLIAYGKKYGISDENKICKEWADDISAHEKMLEIKGIGPALLQYLRMLSGANSLKVDVRVIEELEKLGLPIQWFSPDGILEICENLAQDAGCSLIELDQILWHTNQLHK